MPANHGDFYLLHSDIVGKATEWLDEVCLRERGFRISDLHRIEATIARLATIPDPSPEAVAERERVLDEYRRVWRPRRVELDSVLVKRPTQG
jgi:t-SNARE complex subunit (syntaxin)